jgi:glycosyltransferase involved in cell wall biosynthesis
MAKVSVIVPTFNRAPLIERALKSVFEQTYRDYEVVVVDDGSTDGTGKLLEKYNGAIKYVYQDNSGISAARNRGIRESGGEYIAFLDSDDWWAADKLQEQVNVLASQPKVGIVYGRMPIINDKGEQIGMKPSGVSGKNFRELIEFWGDLPTSTVMTRRECFDKAGTFDMDLVSMEDIDMWLRIARSYDLFEIEGKHLAYYYRHESQVTKNPVNVYEGLVKIYKKILENYPDVPAVLMNQRIAKTQYTLSRIYFDQKDYSKSLSNLLEVLLRYPLVGVLFFEPKDNIMAKTLKFGKPYVFWAVCSLRRGYAGIRSI